MASLAPLLVAFAAAASCGALLPGASAAASRPPAVYVVGDAMGWSVPPTNATTDALNKWAISHRFHVGDVLDFKYSKNNDDSVLLVRRRHYDACSAASPACRLTGGDTWFRLDRPGLLYFIGGMPARCEAGQRMVVHVVGDARSSLGGAPTPAPAPGGPEEDGEPTRSPSGDRPIPVPFTVFVAGFIGFMTGLFFGGLVLWLFINWCS